MSAELPETPRSDNSTNTLYTLVNGVTGNVDGNIRLANLSSLGALYERYGMYDGELSQVLQTGELIDLVVIRPDIELDSP